MEEQNNSENAQTGKKPFSLMQYFNKLSNVQKGLFGAGIIGVSIGVMSLFYVANKTEYKVLFSSVAEKDGGEITAALEQQQIPYQIKDNGSIMVPANQVNELRLKLASQGLPKGGSVGFELLENQKYGTSQFVEQVNYQRGLEGELARTIQSISAVQSARVHIAIPKQSLFVYNNDEKPTASIFLNLHPGRTLNPTQVSGIIHLVASSVPKLNYKDISIVDQNGALISEEKNTGSMSGLSTTQMDFVKTVENKLIKNIETVLNPMLGKDNYKVQVSATVDFSNQEETEEIYKPNETPGSAAIRSKQSQENANVNGSTVAGGVPGTLVNSPPEFPAVAPSNNNGKLTPPTNLPPVPGQANPASTTTTNSAVAGRLDAAGVTGGISTVGGPVQATKNSVVNYEVDKKIRHVKKPSGEVIKLSAAVVINNKTEKDKKGKDVVKEITEAEMKKVESLVKNAISFSDKRGDSLSVVNATFSPVPVEPVVEVPVWKDPENIALAKESFKYILILLGILILWRKLVTPVLKQIEDEKKRDQEFALAMAKKKEAENKFSDDDAKVTIDEYSVVIEKAKGMVSEDSKAAANLVKEWMGANEK